MIKTAVENRNYILNFALALLILTLICNNATSQFNYIRNGTLNGPVARSVVPYGWTVCDSYSTPDIYHEYTPYPSGSGDVIYPVRDSTFIFLRVRGKYHTDEPGPYTYEYITQRLARPLKKDSTYMFGFFYCFNPHELVQDLKDPDIGYPPRLELWAGNDSCAHEKLLMQTEPLQATYWTERHCTFRLTDTSYEYIRVAVSWDSMTMNINHESYNGNLMLDSLSIIDSSSILKYRNGVFDTVKYNTVYFKGDGKTQLEAPQGTSYSWHPEIDLSAYNVQSPIMESYNPQYTVFVGSLTACSFVESFNVIKLCDTLYPNPNLDSLVIYYNPHKTIVLNATPGSKYHWYPNNHLSDTTICCPNLTGYDSLINVTVWDKYSCPFYEKFSIKINCDTIVQDKSIITLDTTINKKADIKLIPEFGEIDSTWNPVKWLSCITCREPIASPDNSIIYNILLKDEYGCRHEEFFKIAVDFFVPNIITPNGDNKNDRFKINGLPDNTTLKIYSKSGILVYSASPYNDSNLWEGTDNDGKALESNTYWYVLENKEKGLLVKGFVFLLR